MRLTNDEKNAIVILKRERANETITRLQPAQQFIQTIEKLINNSN